MTARLKDGRLSVKNRHNGGREPAMTQEEWCRSTALRAAARAQKLGLPVPNTHAVAVVVWADSRVRLRARVAAGVSVEYAFLWGELDTVRCPWSVWAPVGDTIVRNGDPVTLVTLTDVPPLTRRGPYVSLAGDPRRVEFLAADLSAVAEPSVGDLLAARWCGPEFEYPEEGRQYTAFTTPKRRRPSSPAVGSGTTTTCRG